MLVEDIKCSGFYIEERGDTTVGIFPSTWKIEGQFFFSDQSEYDEFVEGLKNAFEAISDERVMVSSFEEIESEEQRFLESSQDVTKRPNTTK